MSTKIKESGFSALDRLADAITEYREANPKPEEFEKFVEHLKYRYDIGTKTLKTAILMLAMEDI